MEGKFIILVLLAVLTPNSLALDEDTLLENFSELKAGEQDIVDAFYATFNGFFDTLNLLCKNAPEHGKYDCKTVAEVKAIKKAQIAAFHEAYDIMRDGVAIIAKNITATLPDAVVYKQLQNLIEVFYVPVNKLLYKTGSVSVAQIDKTNQDAMVEVYEIWNSIFTMMSGALATDNEKVAAAIEDSKPKSIMSATIQTQTVYTAFKLFLTETHGKIQNDRVDCSSMIEIHRNLTLAAINDDLYTKFTLLDYIATVFATKKNQVFDDFKAIDDNKWNTLKGFQNALEAFRVVLVDRAENKDISASLESFRKGFLDGARLAFESTLVAASHMQRNGTASVVTNETKAYEDLVGYVAALERALKSTQQQIRKSKKRDEIQKCKNSGNATLLSFWKDLYDTVGQIASDVDEDLAIVFENAWKKKASLLIKNVVDAMCDVIGDLGTQDTWNNQYNSGAELIVLGNAFATTSSSLINELWYKFNLMSITRLSALLQAKGVTGYLPSLLPPSE